MSGVDAAISISIPFGDFLNDPLYISERLLHPVTLKKQLPVSYIQDFPLTWVVVLVHSAK